MRWLTPKAKARALFQQLETTYGIWHRWFAWYPITISNERVWFEAVERRIDYAICLHTHQIWIYKTHYRNIEDEEGI